MIDHRSSISNLTHSKENCVFDIKIFEILQKIFEELMTLDAESYNAAVPCNAVASGRNSKQMS